MDLLRIFPPINASLNAIAAVLLVRGYIQIRAGRQKQHKRSMQAAFITSICFLASYLTYHFLRYVYEDGAMKTFQGPEALRSVYITILLSHTILAATVPFLAIITLRRGLKNDLRRHVAIAQWTFPIWLYVSVTGVVVYFMLYWL